jgi:hypothetical protein
MNAISLELETASFNPATIPTPVPATHPAMHARPTASSYARKNYALAQAVYRADAIRRIAGPQAARTFLLLAGADAPLINRVMSSSFSERRR